MFGKIKKYALAVLAWALGSKLPETDVKALPVLDTPSYLRHTGKGRNKQPHRFFGRGRGQACGAQAQE